MQIVVYGVKTKYATIYTCRNHEKVRRPKRHCATLYPSQGTSPILVRKIPLSFILISPCFVYIFALYRFRMALVRAETCSKLTYVVV